MRRIVPVLLPALALIALLAVPAAPASAASEEVKLRLNNPDLIKDGTMWFTWGPDRTIRKWGLKVTRRANGGETTIKDLHFSSGTSASPCRKGEMVKVTWPQPGERADYSAYFRIWTTGGKVLGPYVFDFSGLYGKDLHVTWTGKDLDARYVRFKSSNRIVKYVVTVKDTTGQAYYNKTIDCAGSPLPADQENEITWPAPPEGTRVLSASVTIIDPFKQSQNKKMRVQVSIPHDDVNFASGKWDIPAAESAKLDAALTKILEEIDIYKVIKLKLFVAGHTDTVGGSSDNQTLSLNRARSIAAWFKSRNLVVPLMYKGYGESRLKEETGDNADCAANRRAEYILSEINPEGYGGGWSEYSR